MLRLKDQRKVIGNSFGNPMSWRFFPDADGNPIEGEEGFETFDKERQAKDQKAANEQKYHDAQAKAEAAQVRATQAEQQRDQIAQENEANKQKLADLETKALEQGIENVELDESNYTGDDVALVRAIKAQKKANDVISKRLDNLDKAKAKMEAEAQTEAAQRQRTEVFNELLTELDGDYGAQHRNAALAEWDQLVKDGKTPKGNPAKATRMLEKCYKNAKTAADKKAKDGGIDLDSGSGGGGPNVNLRRTKLTPGSLEQVSAQVLAAQKT
jgi:hypothetical protein